MSPSLGVHSWDFWGVTKFFAMTDSCLKDGNGAPLLGCDALIHSLLVRVSIVFYWTLRFLGDEGMNSWLPPFFYFSLLILNPD
jgi:hypothetical protein